MAHSREPDYPRRGEGGSSQLRVFSGDPKLSSTRPSPYAALRRTWRWIDLYGTGLVAVLLLYFAIICSVAFNALSLIYALAFGRLAEMSDPLRWGIGLVAGGVFIQFVHRLYRDIPGLVTTVHDPPPQEVNGIRLEPGQYPDLYQAVAEVGRLIGSPLPDEIWLTHTAACFVCEERRFAISTQRRLNLALGMPQLSVLSTNELKVILAHELAHFGLGETRLRVFSFRFVESLKGATAEMRRMPWWFVNPVYWFCALYVRIFVLLCAPIERHQELRADAISAEAFGGEAAMHTLLKNWQIEQQFDELLGWYLRVAAESKDPRRSNIYRWFGEHWKELSDEGYGLLLQRLAVEESPSLLDSHPTTQQRIKVMSAYPSQEMAESRAAHQLLPDLSELEDRLDAEVRRMRLAS